MCIHNTPRDRYEKGFLCMRFEPLEEEKKTEPRSLNDLCFSVPTRRLGRKRIQQCDKNLSTSVYGLTRRLKGDSKLIVTTTKKGFRNNFTDACMYIYILFYKTDKLL